MTPLEELQAAHKRLSELRDAQDSPGDDWVAAEGASPLRGNILDSEGYVVADVSAGFADAELIVTLHRTVDTQLAILDHGINDNPEWWGPSYEDALRLARAINGETS